MFSCFPAFVWLRKAINCPQLTEWIMILESNLILFNLDNCTQKWTNTFKYALWIFNLTYLGIANRDSKKHWPKSLCFKPRSEESLWLLACCLSWKLYLKHEQSIVSLLLVFKYKLFWKQWSSYFNHSTSSTGTYLVQESFDLKLLSDGLKTV